MSTTPVATTTIEIKDPTLLPFHQMRETAFNQTQGAFDKLYPQWEKDLTSLKHFEIAVRKQGHDLQHEEVVPDLDDLKTQREEDLQIYWWVFKQTIDKIDTFASNIQTVIAFLKPSQMRSYQDEQRIEKEQPAFFEQIKKDKETCLRYAEKLNEVHSKTLEMKGKMIALISSETNNVNWSLQRFCQIVDHDGKPINVLTRSANNIMPWVAAVDIAKPQSQYSEAAVEKLHSVLQNMPLKNKKNNESSKPSSSSSTTATTTDTMSNASNATINSGTSENSATKQETTNTTSGEPVVKSDAGTQQASSTEKSENSAPKQQTDSSTATPTTVNTTASSSETATKTDGMGSRKSSLDLGTKTNAANATKQSKKKENNNT